MLTINLGIIGGGTVGGGVYQALKKNGSLMASRLSVRFRIAGIAVRNPRKKRLPHIPQSLLTKDWKSLVQNPKVNLVVELMGGTTTARTVVLEALKLGKSVVTANKALICEHGEELFSASEKYGANIYYEAAVAGGIPIIKVLRESFSGNRVQSIHGILNGTCNYMLCQMRESGLDFKTALQQATDLGYAEADPTLDVDGYDALHKICILASLAHGHWIDSSKTHVEGIRNILPLDVHFAQSLGYSVKLLGVVKTTSIEKKGIRPRIQVAVHPTLIPLDHVLASVNGVFNAVYLKGDRVGDSLLYGEGAGANATASAILSDLGDAALDHAFGSHRRVPPFVPHSESGSILPQSETVSPFYLRLSVVDRPGTLAKIAAILAESEIGISSVMQPEGHEGKSVPLIMMIHDAREASMNQALNKISRLKVIKAPPVLYRVENFID
jgi:homoserine dehydrogenase